MMRYFNTSGPNIPAQHYTLMREKLVEQGRKMVYNDRYFTIWAPRQTGKSTYFRFLAEMLQAEGYKVAYINFENFKNLSLSDFLFRLSDNLSEQWGIPFEGHSLGSIFRQIENLKTEKAVLIIDEVEGINAEYFGDVLHTIRNAYHSRQSHALKSVILVGVSNIVGVVQDNASPFNIADNLTVPYFTNEETLELLGQHEQETGQLFDPSVKAKISEITANQPGLVNGFAWKLVNDNPTKPVIDYNDYLLVEKWYLRQNLDKNISNVINKGKKYKQFLQQLLFKEAKIPFQIYQDHIKDLYVNGIISYDQDDFIMFPVPLYQKCLHAAYYPYLNGENERIQKDINIDEYLNANGNLNLSKIITDYKVYAQRRGFRYFMEKDENGNFVSIKEAALVYSFETFINAFLGVVGGKSYLEAHAGLGRTDLVITVNDNEQVVENKVYRNITQFNKGKKQLSYYLEKLGLTEGFCLVFVDATVTQPFVVESEEYIEGRLIKTHIVRYDLETDFDEPVVKKARSSKKKI